MEILNKKTNSTPLGRCYQPRLLNSVTQVRDYMNRQLACEELTPAAVHIICHDSKDSPWLSLSANMRMEELAQLCCHNTFVVINACESSVKAEQLTQSVAFVSAWTEKVSNSHCIANSELIYELLCSSEGGADLITKIRQSGKWTDLEKYGAVIYHSPKESKPRKRARKRRREAQ